VPSSRLWLEARAGHYGESDVVEPAGDREDQEFYLDLTGGGRWAGAENCGDPDLPTLGAAFAPGCLGGTWKQSKDDGTRDEARAAAMAQAKTGRLDHEVKVGGSWRRSRFEVDGHWPGAVEGPFRDRDGNVLNPRGVSGHIWLLFDDYAELIDVDLNDSQSESEEVAFFLQDRVRVSERLTLDLGVRTESFESTGDRTATDPNLRLKFGFEDMIAPRLGVAWDPFGKGRSRLFGHYGRSYESVPLALNSLAFLFDDSWLYDFEYPADGSLPSVGNLGELISYGPIGVSPEHVATDLQPMYSDSYALGFEYQIGSELSVGLTGIYREVGNAIDDICIVTCFIGNPGGIYRVDPVTGAALPAPVIVPEPVREYRALQLAFQKRLRDNWQLSGSYVYSKLEGNYGGAIHEATRFINPHFTEAFDSPQRLANTFGFLPNDRTHQAKLYGSYEWSFGLTSGLVAQFFTGTPVSKRGAYPGFGGGGQRFITRRGSEGRTPDIYTIDLHLAYSIPIGKVLSLSLFGDVFNVTDAQRAVSVDEVWTRAAAEATVDPNECGGPGTGPGTACPRGNPNWGGPLTFQEPRTVRLGTRLSW
jgi:outer membrane receptor protein involved in Fe transport